MGTYNYSYHIRFNVTEDRDADVSNLGLLVWDESLTDLRYYGTRGEQDHARGFHHRLEDAKKNGSLYGPALKDALDYFLERGGGGYQSFSIPEQIEAESFEDAAKEVDAAAKHKLDLVIPESDEQRDEDG